MKKYTIRPCRVDSPEVECMAKSLREADIREVMASHGYQREKIVTKALRLSTESYMALNREGNPICVFGVTDSQEFGGCVWLLGTEELNCYVKDFLKESKEFIKKWLDKYQLLFNFVDIRNEKSIRWLKWLGFQLKLIPDYGINGEDFYYFWMRKEED